MYELESYIKTPLTTGDEVNIVVGGIDVVKCEVVRVEYNYHNIEGLHKVLARSFDPTDNVIHDDVSGKDYFCIVLQEINL